MVGSRWYADHLTREELAKIDAMVNMDTLGLGPTEIWQSRAHPILTGVMIRVAGSMHLPVSGVNVEKVGSTDSESFVRRKVPSITVHSLTQKTLAVLHSDRDRLEAIKMDDYYDSYRLIAAYLAFLDGMPPAEELLRQAKQEKELLRQRRAEK